MVKPLFIPPGVDLSMSPDIPLSIECIPPDMFLFLMPEDPISLPPNISLSILSGIPLPPLPPILDIIPPDIPPDVPYLLIFLCQSLLTSSHPYFLHICLLLLLQTC